VSQEARNLDLADQGVRFLIRDRGSKYTGTVDEVLRGCGIRVVKSPVRAPKANAIAEHFVRTVRAECLDWLLIVNRSHLKRVLRTFVEPYNTQRPHRALNLQLAGVAGLEAEVVPVFVRLIPSHDDPHGAEDEQGP
jgi:transposase InsO family protein